MKINNNEKEGLYISFSKAVKILKVKPHILLYWEKKIPQLKAYRISNRKFYKKEQIKLLTRVKKLLEEGYSLEGIKKILKQEHPAKSSTEKDPKKIIKEVLKELKEIYKNL
ncbi:MAG: MerR family transcriptional regulator [Thermodesulfobacterium sp.]|nr:MerR family transcriptional regulator [Thermodesulfobacterium sp.]